MPAEFRMGRADDEASIHSGHWEVGRTLTKLRVSQSDVGSARALLELRKDRTSSSG